MPDSLSARQFWRQNEAVHSVLESRSDAFDKPLAGLVARRVFIVLRDQYTTPTPATLFSQPLGHTLPARALK